MIIVSTKETPDGFHHAQTVMQLSENPKGISPSSPRSPRFTATLGQQFNKPARKVIYSPSRWILSIRGPSHLALRQSAANLVQSYFQSPGILANKAQCV